MDTYDSSLAPRFRQFLAHREAELRGVLHANDHLPDEVGEAESQDVTDFKEMTAKQSLATVTAAKVDHAVHELELVLATRCRLTDSS